MKTTSSAQQLTLTTALDCIRFGLLDEYNVGLIGEFYPQSACSWPAQIYTSWGYNRENLNRSC